MPMLIGERINPTGKSKFKQALRDRNMEYILEMGVKQSDAGAQILDVNVGLPEINEPELMKETVYQLQSILDAPLQIDTTNMEAMEQALRYIQRKTDDQLCKWKAGDHEAGVPTGKKIWWCRSRISTR